MKLFAFLIILVSCCRAQADCSTAMQLQGGVSIKQCSPASGDCVRADEALQKYMNAKPDDGPTTLSIATHGSPWHLYDGDYHLLEIEELAAMVRQQGSKIKRVILVASWSGIAPGPHSKSLAQKLSEALGGLPVTGQDGFVWISPKGALHTTHQAFTGRVSGPYWVDFSFRQDDMLCHAAEFAKSSHSDSSFSHHNSFLESSMTMGLTKKDVVQRQLITAI